MNHLTGSVPTILFNRLSNQKQSQGTGEQGMNHLTRLSRSSCSTGSPTRSRAKELEGRV